MRRIPIFSGFLLVAACGGGSGTAPAVSISPQPGSPPPDVVSISEVQGSRMSSPLVGQVISVSGVVTGDFQDNDENIANNLGGFYIQQESPDADDTTSDGIFVFDGNSPATNVAAGDRVDVRGTVNEYFGETQISTLTVTIVGSGSVAPTDVSLPVNSTTTNSDGDLVGDLERYEGMLLRFPQTLTITNLRNLERFGSVSLSQGGRLYQFTNANPPDALAYAAHKESNARRTIELDDGQRSRNPTTFRYFEAGTAADHSIRNGDSVTGVTGNLRYARGSGRNGDETWRLMPTVAPQFDSSNPRPGAPSVGGNLRVASFNVPNFFSTVDTGQAVCGPQRNENCRGADSNEELARQLAKTVSALAIMNADIVGLIELENNKSESLRMIVDALNTRIGSSDYAFVDTGTIHDDAIKTGFIYRESKVGLASSFALLDRSTDSRFNDARNRPALAQTFEVSATGAVLTVVVNHLKSKGSNCNADGDPNLSDGQGNCNQTRASAATAIAEWLATDPTDSNDPDFLIIGDFNAYTEEDPLSAFASAGFTNLIDSGNDPYSFVFDAQAGALDHAIASASLVPQVVGAIVWHVNADEPALLDYNLENDRNPALFDPDSPYRSSDHDPVVIGLNLAN